MARLILFSVLSAVFPVSAGKAYEMNVRRASDYIVRNAAKLDARTVRTLSLLSKLYVLDRELIRVLEQAEKKFPEEKRIPGELEIRTQKGWRGMNLMARYCRKYPLPWDYLERLAKLAEPDEGTLTRALFVLAFVELRDCDRDRKSFSAELDRYALEVVSVLQGSEAGNELWVESVLALQFSGKGDWIGEEIMSLLLAAQQKDGSWSGNTWATARALSILLEMQAGRLGRENRRKLQEELRAAENF